MPKSRCSDSTALFYPQREVCYASMEREAANAKWQALHEKNQWHNGTWTSWAEKRSDEHPYHRDHGVTIGVALSDLRPDDRFLADIACGPPEGIASEPSEHDEGEVSADGDSS